MDKVKFRKARNSGMKVMTGDLQAAALARKIESIMRGIRSGEIAA